MSCNTIQEGNGFQYSCILHEITFWNKLLCLIYSFTFSLSSTWPSSVDHNSSEDSSIHNVKEQLSKYGLGTPSTRVFQGSLFKSNYFIIILRYYIPFPSYFAFSPSFHSLMNIRQSSRSYMMCGAIIPWWLIICFWNLSVLISNLGKYQQT